MICNRNGDNPALAVFFHISLLGKSPTCILPVGSVVNLAQIKSLDQVILNRRAIEHVHKKRARTLHSEQVSGHASQAST